MEKKTKQSVGLTIYYMVLILVVASVTVNQLKILNQFQTNEQVIHSRLDYDEFRRLQISPDLARMAAESEDVDYAAYIAYEMLSNNYNLSKCTGDDIKATLKQIDKVKNSDVYEELYYYYQMIFPDLRYFPVPLQLAQKESVAFDNSWGSARTFGGERQHEGTDVMTTNNVRGFFPIISVSDGVVEKKGWLSQGGYRLGIRAPHGAYFYYAHLYDYAPGIKEGEQVKAGQLIGFMGDSGYGDEGTVGQFDVHLHFGIYLNSKEGEMSVNPYWILKSLESKRLTFDF